MGLFGLPEIAGCQLQRHSMAVSTVAAWPILLRILWKKKKKTLVTVHQALTQSSSSPSLSYLLVPQRLTWSLGNRRLKKLSNRKKM